MKAFSTIEPYASLITYGPKTIETRAQSTKYRGPVLIHASRTKTPETWLNNESIMKYVKNEFKPGYIIGKAILSDCIRITTEFIETLTETEIECGFYTVSRYAWILTNIEPLEKPIPARGMLGIWEYTGKEIKA